MEFIVNLCEPGSLWKRMSILRREAVGPWWVPSMGKIRTKNEDSTMKFQYSGKAAVATMLALVMLAGCKSKEDAAIDKAKQQAAATGQPQQVVSTDKNGNVTTTTVQPPAPGQKTQAVTATVTPAAGGAATTATANPAGHGQRR